MSRSRLGLTVIAWLVLIVCIGIVLSLMIPAISTPGRPRRTNACAKNRNNLALAAIQYVLLDLYQKGEISYDTALTQSHDPNFIRHRTEDKSKVG